MDIYTPIAITEKIRSSFRPCRLYIKELAGIKYFGKSLAPNINEYLGSGVVWKKRIKKYGHQNVKTLWVSDWYTDPELLQEVALGFSKENDIVNSDEWANLKPENGSDGGSPKGTNLGRKRPDSEKANISKSKKGKKINRVTPLPEYAKQHLSKINTGKTIPKEVVEKMLATKRNNGTLNHTEKTKEKMRKPKTLEAVANMKSANNPRSAGGVWINDGTQTKYTKGKIPEGWIRGRLLELVPPSQKNKIWINDGKQSKMSFTIPYGWVRGRLKIR